MQITIFVIAVNSRYILKQEGHKLNHQQNLNRVLTVVNRHFSSPFQNCLLRLFNLLNYSATSICKYIIQVLITTGTLKHLRKYIYCQCAEYSGQLCFYM